MKTSTRARNLSDADRLFAKFDTSLRSILGNTRRPQRRTPADQLPKDEMTDAEKVLSGRLMRVNHCGEVCAQALYLGQSLTSRQTGTRQSMREAAQEEVDHLGWCEERLAELDTKVSRLNPLFFVGSMLTGMAIGLAGDKYNLGFVAATEEQVVTHLDGHLKSLPKSDLKSHAIISQMKSDEDKHKTSALRQGGIDFPGPVKQLMTLGSRLMTRSTYWI